MKKLIATLLALTLLLGMCTVAQAKTVDITAQGLTIDVPDDFESVMDDESDVETVLLFKPAGEDPARYEFAMGESEEHAKRWMEELNEAEREDLFYMYSGDLDNPSFELKKVNDLDWMIIRDGKNTELAYVTLIYGYMCQIVGMRTDGEPLTDASTAMVEQLVMSLKVKELQENQAQ